MATLTKDELEDPKQINKFKSMGTLKGEQLVSNKNKNTKKPLILQLSHKIDRYYDELLEVEAA